MVAGAAQRLVSVQLPLSLHPLGSVPVAEGIALYEDEEGTGSVFVWGQVAWTWDASDPGARRLAAVQLVNAGGAGQRAVARAFGVNENTVWRWRREYTSGGMGALLPVVHGPKGPSKLTEEKMTEIRSLRTAGKTLAQVAESTGVSTDSVRRATALATSSVDALGQLELSEPTSELVPLARPKDRSTEREAARRGMLEEAPPVICEGAELPLVGSLVILPALVQTGLVEVAASVYGHGRRVAGRARSAFYGLRSLLLCVVFSSLVGEPRAEGLTRIDPVAVGRLLGLDRAPEVTRLRFRMEELAQEHRSDELVVALAARHLERHLEAVGLFYVDGHVRAYHGKAEIGKAHVARMRIAMPGEIDTWVSDRFGDGLLVWQSDPGASLVGELATVTEKIRALVGEDARPTICFDRGGWSPKLFAELDGGGFDILTYRKGPKPHEPRSAFSATTFTDEAGHPHHYLLADRRVRLSYDAGRKRFACRQITRLDDNSGHQTQVITTRTDPDAGLVAHSMFGRWRQENFFRYQRAHFALDALDAYATIADDTTRSVANPRRRDANRQLRQGTNALEQAEAAVVRDALKDGSAGLEAVEAAKAEIERLRQEASAIPTRVPLAEVRPGAVRIDVERKRIMDAIRMATYNAESALARLVSPHYARAEDEARSLLHEIFSQSGDLQVQGDHLYVRIRPLSAPRRTRALAALCEELTATETTYPGTELVLVYSVKEV